MSTIHFKETTTSTPERFVAALTDFGPGRSKVWGNSADNYLTVYERGSDEADVKEGSGGVWERLHYDWSDPNRSRPHDHRLQRMGRPTRATPHSLTRRSDGTTDVDVVIVREGKNLKGRVLAIALGACGKRVLEKRFDKTVKAIEAADDGPETAGSS